MKGAGSGATLTRATLTSEFLGGADLTEATLSGADLGSADLTRAPVPHGLHPRVLRRYDPGRSDPYWRQVARRYTGAERLETRHPHWPAYSSGGY